MILRRRKMHKNSLFILVTILVVIAVFGVGTETFAQQAQTVDQYVTQKANWLNLIMNAIYVFLWPVLIIAGKSLDNSLIYAEFLGLDAPLRTFWNIAKNFANFTLGFLVLWEIIKNIFAVGDKGKAAFGVIKKALIGGIGIQASWFLLAALIDISTIATVGIGGLPLSILHGDNAPSQCLADKQVVGVGSQLDTSNTTNADSLGKGFNHYYFTKAEDGTKRYYSPCLLDQNNPSYVIGRQYNVGTIDGQEFQQDACILFGSRAVSRASGQQLIYERSYSPTAANSEYINNIKDLVDTGASWTGWLQGGRVFDISTIDSSLVRPAPGVYIIGTLEGDGWDNDLSLGSILSYAEGMMGPLVTLYSSIVNFAELNDSTRTHNSSRDMALSMIIKSIAAIALFIPLIFLAIVLLLRIAYIWLYIVMSPFIVLIMAFGDKVGGAITDAVGDMFKIGQILKTIFAPVIVVFALSIGLLFMTVLSQGLANTSDVSSCDIATHSQTIDGLGVEQSADKKCYNIMTFQICFDQETNFFGGIHDPLAWVLINLFAIAIMWFIVFAALEFIGMKRFGGGSVVNRGFAGNVLGSLPVIPIPTKNGGVKGVGVATAGNLLESKVTRMSDLSRRSADYLKQGKKDDDDDKTNPGGSNSSNANSSVAKALAGGSSIQDLNANQTDGESTPNPYTNTSIRNLIKQEVENIAGEDKRKREEEWNKQLEHFKKNIQYMTPTDFTRTINATDEFALRMRPLPGSYIKLKNDKIYRVTYTNKQFSVDEITDGSVTAPTTYDAVQTQYDQKDTALTPDAVDARLAQQNTQTPPTGGNTPPTTP